MSQLYFTASQIPSQQFTSLEELFKVLTPADVLIVFDTNIVVYYRDFLLNPREFVSRKETLDSIEYLVDSIKKYDLEVNASIGTDESSRSKYDFSINVEKAKQTQTATQFMFAMNKHTFRAHLHSGYRANAITTSDQLAISKIASLKQQSTFSGLLTLSYACVLKIYILYRELEDGRIDRRTAYLQFLTFAMDEADGIAVTILSFAYHLFGGVTAFKAMLFARASSNGEEKLHQLFNGAIDLIFPYIANRAQDYFPANTSKKLIPILVTGDKRLSMLHSICNSHFILDYDKVLVAEDLPLAQIAYFEGEKMKWTKSDNEIFKQRTMDDIPKRYASANGPEKKTDHLYPIITNLESQVWALFNNTKV